MSGNSERPLDKVIKEIKSILNPLGSYREQWNRLFLLSTVIALSLDPVFFYIIVVNEDKKCLLLDTKLGITAIVLRSVIDCFYIVCIACRLQTDLFAPLLCIRDNRERNCWKIVRRYLLPWFFPIDILAVLPLPQVVILLIIPTMKRLRFLDAMVVLKSVVIFQYVPRVLRIYPLFKRHKRTSGILAEAAWANAVFNLFLYILAGHVLGAVWYFFAIEREATCWHKACGNQPGCANESFYCDFSLGNHTLFLNNVCPISSPDTEYFDFGIYFYALQSGIVKVTNFWQKFFHCFRWGIQNLSSFGQNLQTSTYIWENCFAAFIIISGLVLFLFLIGNVQIYLQSKTMKLEEMRLATREINQWKPFKKLSPKLKEEVNQYQRYVWQHTRGVNVEKLLQNLPKEIKKKIKGELCLDLLNKVELFKSKGRKLLNALCFCVKPVLFIEHNHLIEEGDTVYEMLFVVEGELQVYSSSSNEKACLQGDDFCGKELVEWVQDPDPLHLPVSGRSIQALTRVEAFALQARDMKHNLDAIHIQAAARVISAFRKKVREKQLNSQPVNGKAVKNLSRSSSSPSNGSKYGNESSTSRPGASRFRAKSLALLEAQPVIFEEK
ncbi:hypothetical protein SLE2022_403290 [Rubroshorea leprosula]